MSLEPQDQFPTDGNLHPTALPSRPDSADQTNPSNPPSQTPGELTLQLDDLLEQITTKFTAVCGEIYAKMDDMGRRLDNLETSINASQQAAGGNESGGQQQS